MIRLLVLSLLIAVSIPLRAEEPPTGPDAARELVRQEQVRQKFEASIELFQQPAAGVVRTENFVEAAHRLVPLGADVVPFLANEIQQTLSGSYFFAAYALGLVGTPEAEVALRGAVDLAESEGSSFAMSRKAWACYGLGLMGRADAVDLLNEGRHQAAGAPIHKGMSALEAVAFQTAPESVPLLLAQFDRYDEENDPRFVQRRLVLEALGRIGDPSAAPLPARVLKEGGPELGRRAAFALGHIGSEEATTALLEALATPDAGVRGAVAQALDDALPVGHLDAVLERLESEEVAAVRGPLYRLAVRLGGAEVLPGLARYLDRPDPRERMFLVRAVGTLRGPEAIPFLRRALTDPAAEVVAAAVVALRRIGTAEASAGLLDLVASPDWTRARPAVNALATVGDSRAAGPIADRLIDVELAQTVADPYGRQRAVELADALVDLRAPRHMRDLEEAVARQVDPLLREPLDHDMEALRLMARKGTKTKPWIKALASPEPHLREAAYAVLAGSGSERAARALADAFDRVPEQEQSEIVRALGSLDLPASRELLRRVLTDPAFDSITHLALRDAAAWSARRLGGEAMVALLREAVDRRSGRDFLPLVYLGVLGRERALPVLERWRVERLRYIRWTRGLEQQELDRLHREIASGRAPDEYDLPPQELVLH